MAQKDCVPYGSDVSAGSFECRDCGYVLKTPSVQSLPPCPEFDAATHALKCWKVLSGQGDSPDDPYPDK